jgi:hypothetical protein
MLLGATETGAESRFVGVAQPPGPGVRANPRDSLRGSGALQGSECSPRACSLGPRTAEARCCATAKMA